MTKSTQHHPQSSLTGALSAITSNSTTAATTAVPFLSRRACFNIKPNNFKSKYPYAWARRVNGVCADTATRDVHVCRDGQQAAGSTHTFRQAAYNPKGIEVQEGVPSQLIMMTAYTGSHVLRSTLRDSIQPPRAVGYTSTKPHYREPDNTTPVHRSTASLKGLVLTTCNRCKPTKRSLLGSSPLK